MKFIKILQNNKKLLKNIIFIFLLDYIILFCLETILPGSVMNLFNLNYFLILIIFFCLFYAFLSDKIKLIKNKKSKPYLWLLFSLIGLSLFTFLFILMGNGLLEISIYFILTFLICLLLYKSFGKKNSANE